MCKKCKKAFRKDMSTYEESDEYCPHCDNGYVNPVFHHCVHGSDACEQVLEAKTPSAMLGVEGEDARKDSRMIRDDRVQEKQRQVRIVLFLHLASLRPFLAVTGRNDFRKADVTRCRPADCSSKMSIVALYTTLEGLV